MSVVRVLVDDRENWRADLVEAYPQNVTSVRLDDGDIQMWCGDDLILIIERKTISDLCASVKDGRFVNQRNNLKTKYDKARILYLIEGPISFSARDDARRVHSMDIAVLRGSVINTLVRDGIHVFCTRDYRDMLGFLRNTIDRLIKDPRKYIGNEPTPDVIKTKRKTGADHDSTYIAMLCQLPGISQTIAKQIAKQCPDITSLVKIAALPESEVSAHLNAESTRRKLPVNLIRIIKVMFGSVQNDSTGSSDVDCTP